MGMTRKVKKSDGRLPPVPLSWWSPTTWPPAFRPLLRHRGWMAGCLVLLALELALKFTSWYLQITVPLFKISSFMFHFSYVEEDGSSMDMLSVYKWPQIVLRNL